MAAPTGSWRRWALGRGGISSFGAGQGPLVLCLHGFPDNADSFRHQLPALTAAGFQVECPLLPGYEPNSRHPEGHYDLEAVSNSLAELIDHMTDDSQEVHLVGHDWGALISYALAVRQPRRFASLTALTIPYNLSLGSVLRRAPAYLRNAWYIQLFQVPVLAEHLLERDNWHLVERLIRQWSPDWSMPADHLAAIKCTLSQPGVKRAALAYYRAIYGSWPGARHARRLLNTELSLPCLLIQGLRDGCIHDSLWRLLNPASFPRGLCHERVDAGHFPHQERPEEVNELILNWVRTHRQNRPA